MKAELIEYRDEWKMVNLAARVTTWNTEARYPSSEWKRRIIRSEHSPIRLMHFYVLVTDAPYYSIMHLVRHHVGLQPFVGSQRPDRSLTHTERSDLPQDAPVMALFEINGQALIDISNVRLCNLADPVTRKLWTMIIDAIGEKEPELRDACVKSCVYRGFCPEMKSCKWWESEEHMKERLKYVFAGRGGEE